MQKENTRRGFTHEIVNKKETCPEEFLLRAFHACRGNKEETLNLPMRRALRAPLRFGFTLIELLVVVLIIGILAAVALPQYQKVVVKSRIMQVVSYLHAVKQAEEIFYLENGRYTNDITQLNIESSCPQPWSCVLMAVEEAKANASYPPIRIMVSFDHRITNPSTRGFIYCAVELSKANTLEGKVCTSMGPLLDGSGGYLRHALSR